MDRRSTLLRWIYGSGDFGFSLTCTIVDAHVAIFLTDLVGIKPAVAAAAIFIGRSSDYLNDPPAGYLSDRTRTRWGRRRPFLLFGARIVVWPEANLMVFAEDEEAFLECARRFAREHAIFLLMGMGTFDLGAARPVRNHAVLVDPQGEMAYSYTKITAVPGFEARTNIRGRGPIPVCETPYGRIVSPICYDLDFPQVVRQVGRSKADIMLVPASDWQAIGPLHQAMSEFRAVENGVAMYRIARWGQAGAVDPYGRRLAAMDDFASENNVMVAQVPVKGVRTIYARIGDLFAWLCVAGLLISIGTGIVRLVGVR